MPQNVTLHPRLHCIVHGGGLTEQGKCKTAKSDGKYLFNAKAIGKTFRGKFIAILKEQLSEQMVKRLHNNLNQHQWAVDAKRQFTGPSDFVVYLGRYPHKIAISNHRINNIANGKVGF